MNYYLSSSTSIVVQLRIIQGNLTKLTRKYRKNEDSINNKKKFKKDNTKML